MTEGVKFDADGRVSACSLHIWQINKVHRPTRMSPHKCTSRRMASSILSISQRLSLIPVLYLYLYFSLLGSINIVGLVLCRPLCNLARRAPRHPGRQNAKKANPARRHPRKDANDRSATALAPEARATGLRRVCVCVSGLKAHSWAGAATYVDLMGPVCAKVFLLFVSLVCVGYNSAHSQCVPEPKHKIQRWSE